MDVPEKAYDNFLAIETEQDLKKNKLTLEDFDEVHRILLDIDEKGYAFTTMENAKNWVEHNDISIVKESEGEKQGWLMYY